MQGRRWLMVDEGEETVWCETIDDDDMDKTASFNIQQRPQQVQ